MKLTILLLKNKLRTKKKKKKKKKKLCQSFFCQIDLDPPPLTKIPGSAHVIFFLTLYSIHLLMCFGRSKEPSHRDGSFEYPKYMLWPRNEKTRDNLSSKFPRRVCSATVTSENLNIFKTSPFLELCAKILYPYNCASAQAHLSLICCNCVRLCVVRCWKRVRGLGERRGSRVEVYKWF